MSLSLPGILASDYTVFSNIFQDAGVLKIGHFNAQSLGLGGSKFLEIYNLLYKSNLDIICISESWLKDMDSSIQIALPGFESYRCDRTGRRGGGAYVSSKFKCKVLYQESFYESVTNCYEILFIELIIGVEKLCVGVAYIPPRSSIERVEDLISNYSCRYADFILVGDFNSNIFDTRKRSVIDELCDRNDLTLIHNDMPTHYDLLHNSFSLLDMYLVRNVNKVVSNEQFWLPSSISKHAFITLSYNYSSTPVTESVVTFRNLNRIVTNNLLIDASLLDLSRIVCTPNV